VLTVAKKVSGIIQSEPVRFRNSSHRYIGRFLKFYGQISPRTFPLPLYQCGNLYGMIMSFAWIAAIWGECCVGISVISMV
jgi:hypothetical protein